MIAAFRDYDQIVESLLKHGVDPEIRETNGRIALWFAISNGGPLLVRVLSKYGALATMKNTRNKTILHAIALADVVNIAVINALWQLDLTKVEVEATNNEGLTTKQIIQRREALTCEEAAAYESLFNDASRITSTERGIRKAEDQTLTTEIREYSIISINEVNDHDVDENSDDYFVDAVEIQVESLTPNY